MGLAHFSTFAILVLPTLKILAQMSKSCKVFADIIQGFLKVLSDNFGSYQFDHIHREVREDR